MTAALLVTSSALASTACLNPLFLSQVDPDADHAPQLSGITPPPNIDQNGAFGRMPIQVGANCRPVAFGGTRLDDADLDVLTLRQTMIIPDGSDNVPRRFALPDSLLTPSPTPAANGSFYAPLIVELDQVTVVNRLLSQAVLDDQDAHHKEQGQLFEIRVSDAGFATGVDEPPPGFGMVVVTWPIVLQKVDCTGGGE